MNRIALVGLAALLLGLVLGPTGCYWGEGAANNSSDLKVTLDGYCFADESLSPTDSEALVVWLRLENRGDRALYLDCDDFAYIATDAGTALPDPGSYTSFASCPSADCTTSPQQDRWALKPKQRCACRLAFSADALESIPEDRKLTLVVYGEETTGEGSMIEMTLKPLKDTRRCTLSDVQ